MIKSDDRVCVGDARGRARDDRGDDPGASTTGTSICSCASRSRWRRSRRECGRWSRKRVARGRVELSLSLQLRQTPGVDVEFNEEFGRALEAALEQARERGLVDRRADAGRSAAAAAGAHDSRAPGRADDERRRPSWRRRRAAAVDQALVDLDAMRSREGDHLRADLDSAARRSSPISSSAIAVAADEGRGGDGAAARRARARAAHRAAGRRDRGRAGNRRAWRRGPTSAKRWRASAATSSHWVALADGAEPCGRKLDFLLQEMNREVNTMGSKADGLRVSELDHRGQGGAREDARAGPECRVAGSTGRRGLLFIVSAPSGAGKTTLVERLVEQVPAPADVALVHVARRRGRAKPTAWTIIL